MDSTIVNLVRDLLIASAGALSSAPKLPVDPADGSVALNEIVASNDESLIDEDGDSSDWIELRNDTAHSQSLDGWYLTDDAADPTQWRLPAVSIPAFGYLVVFASNKNRAVPGSELHTNFRLSAGGEYLGLFLPDGVTAADEFAPAFPSLAVDEPYGRPYDDQAPEPLALPTPNAPNSGRRLPTLQIEPTSTIFDSGVGSIEMELAADAPLGTSEAIHYTLDGSEPDAFSPVYVDTVMIDATTRVRARVVDGSTVRTNLGPLAQASYTEVAGSIVNASSTLPLIVIDTFGAEVSTDEVLMTPSLVTVIERDGINGTSVTDPADYSGYAGLRVRGSSSAEFPKKQYKLELWTEIEDSTDVDLLGMGLESDWVLYAPGRYDRAFVNNPLIYELSSQLGLVAMQTRFCEVYLNDGPGPVTQGDYDGIYVLTESIKISPERVDVAKLESQNLTEPDISGGYIFAVDRADLGEHNWYTQSGFPISGGDLPLMNITRPKLVDLVPTQTTWVEDHFDAFELALYGPDFTDPVLGYRAFIDAGSWIDHHLVRLIGLDPDFLWLSNFMFKDRAGLIQAGPVWDMDRSLDSDDERDDDPTWIGERRDPFAWEWWGRLSEDPAYRSEYTARWLSLRQSVLSEANIFALVDQFHAEIAEAYPREDARWGGAADYGPRSPVFNAAMDCGFTCDFTGDFQGEIDHLKNWISARLAFIDQLVALYDREDLALGRPATQSSVNATGFPGIPELAVDGDNNGHLPQGKSCTRTEPEDQPWWEVDLGSVQDVSYVRVWNRTDCCSDKLTNFHVFLSDVPFAGTSVADAQSQPGVTDLRFLPTAGTLEDFLVGRSARYIRVQLQFFGVLSVAEVEVFVGTNLAPTAAVAQSSTSGDATPDRAIDGVTDGDPVNASVSLTELETEPWLELDLGVVASIESVRIWNRTDPCCSADLADLHVLVSEQPFLATDLATTQSQPGVTDFALAGSAGESELFEILTSGRYVRIQAEGEQVLGLAEVQVFGQP